MKILFKKNAINPAIHVLKYKEYSIIAICISFVAKFSLLQKYIESVVKRGMYFYFKKQNTYDPKNAPDKYRI